jgi:hypothetical protein
VSDIPLSTKVKTVSIEALNWARNGFGLTTDDQYNARFELCRQCDKWNALGYANTGECTVCGCSTVAKLKLTTTKCPLDKWEAIT